MAVEIEKLKAATSVRTPAELRSLTGEIVDQLRLLPNGTPQTKKTVIHNLVERLEISQRKIVRLVPTAKVAPFFTALMSVDVGVNPIGAQPLQPLNQCKLVITSIDDTIPTFRFDV